MIRKLLLTILPLVLSANEPSAFDAGNLDLENPYGLTQSEKVTLQNKKQLQKLDQTTQELKTKLNSMAREFDNTDEKIEGLLSVVDGSNKGLHERLLKQKEQIEHLKKQNSDLEQAVNSLEAEHNSTIKKFNAAIEELTRIVNTINKNYVDRKKFRKLEEAFFKLEKNVIAQKEEKLGPDNWTIYVDMQEFYEKQEYDEVEKRAKHLIGENYKKASANYYLGEVYFYEKNYEDAIYYFKKSWSLYDESEFMPVLLLHSAISLEKLGKQSEADTFYQSLIDSYPNTKEAKEAQKKLKGK